MLRPIAVTVLAFGLGMSASSVLAAEVDPSTGFIIAPGWESVRNNCVACHSATLVTQNSGSREHWLSLIRWMQDGQGLWQFDPLTENTILNYLTENYGPKQDARRPALRIDELPVNPYRAKQS
ncbi:hypothetical protein TOI97_12830 [Denitrificimonas sp. JX-1]|uniref:Sulfite dehydrogenase (Cytochrome) subunit SorB n=1 Tax=Denitrificimonas halotolerans TaxID=3098930 RepID=A0ABU5GTY6_9GAMM|nr:hypothetical protein [Denitrificimonas sp. JX-1]MDY7220447.1 hypothetical protein [Denitrificimonas sp. JX-1]